MTIWLANVAAYSLQLAVLVLSAVCAAALVRLRAPRASLHFWQTVLFIGVALPALQPWPADAGASVMTSLTFTAAPIATPPFQAVLQVSTLVLQVLAAGAAARLMWLAAGLVGIWRLTNRAAPLSPQPGPFAALQEALGTTADVRLTDDVDVPVTVGARRAVVLLPRRTLCLAPAVQQAILCHELIHVRRRDWLRTIAEECWCALLWFHPGVRLLASRVCLAREVLVDHATIAHTRNRRAYLRALLAFADASHHRPAAATPFLRARHLSQRIAMLSQEVAMSRSRVAVAFGVASVVVALATASTVARAPLATAAAAPAATHSPQETAVPGSDDAVTPPRVIHEVKPEYTEAAMKAGIQGSVYLSVVVSETGETGTVKVVRSLDTVHGLDESAVAAASQWRFEPGRKDGKAVPVEVTIEMTFTLKK